MKIFNNLDKYTVGRPFKGWLRRIMINASIDHFRKYEKHYNTLDISYAQYQPTAEVALDSLSAEEILAAVSELPPSYKLAFNLYVIEGFKHEEIANQLGISVGTSKSNLSIARSKLQKILLNIRGERKIAENNG